MALVIALRFIKPSCGSKRHILRTLPGRYSRKRRILYLMAADRMRDIRAFTSETKFLVPAEFGEPLRQWARRHLAADPHGHGPNGDEYLTTTLYFDTLAFD